MNKNTISRVKKLIKPSCPISKRFPGSPQNRMNQSKAEMLLCGKRKCYVDVFFSRNSTMTKEAHLWITAVSCFETSLESSISGGHAAICNQI